MRLTATRAWAAAPSLCGGWGLPTVLSGSTRGCGVGQWCLAFAGFGGRATGVETQPELVGIAEFFARAVGFGERVRFLAERIETADLPADAVWSHSALMFTDAETAVNRAWLPDLEELLQSDCPRLVCDVISSADPDLAEESRS